MPRGAMKAAVVIPALNEGATIARVVASLHEADLVSDVIVVDGGSTDGTAQRAQAAGAVVVHEPRPGYGRACLEGAREAVRRGAGVVAFVDGALAEDPGELPRVLAPIAAGEAELSLGSRTLGRRERGALRPAQRAGNRVATTLIWLLHGRRYTDLGSMRAIRVDALERLDLRELGHGWPVEMQVKAARAGLRIVEVPVSYRRRRGGRSKVSGSLRGSLLAGTAILRVVIGRSP